MNTIIQKLNNIFIVKKVPRFYKYGLPFLLLVVGGSFGLKEFTSLRYQYGRKNRMLNPEELAKEGITMKKPGEVTLESEFEKIQNLDIDNWENIRGPRPWEEETLQQNKKKLS